MFKLNSERRSCVVADTLSNLVCTLNYILRTRFYSASRHKEISNRIDYVLTSLFFINLYTGFILFTLTEPPFDIRHLI